MTKQETAALYRAVDLLDQLAPGLDNRRRGLLLRVREQLELLLGEGEPDGKKKVGSLYSREQWDWVAERYMEGYQVTDLAAFLDTTDATVRTYLRRLGAPRRFGRRAGAAAAGLTLEGLEDRKREFYALV